MVCVMYALLFGLMLLLDLIDVCFNSIGNYMFYVCVTIMGELNFVVGVYIDFLSFCLILLIFDLRVWVLVVCDYYHVCLLCVYLLGLTRLLVVYSGFVDAWLTFVLVCFVWLWFLLTCLYFIN